MISNLKDINSFQKGVFLIPNIEYKNVMPNLYRTNFTTRALITNILKNNYFNIIDSVFDIEYNKMNDTDLMKYLENSIRAKIKKYLVNPDDTLLISIFNSIQIWGGNSARMFYLKNGFESNFDLSSYKNAILILRSENESSLYEVIKLFKNIKKMNIAYASKHFSFWTSDFNGFGNKKQLPILDRLINNLVYGKSNQPDYRHYENYINDMCEISNKLKIEINIIERTLFNFADTIDGREWIRRRIG